MSQQETVTFPETDEMLEKLRSVKEDREIEKYYQMLVKRCAGQTCTLDEYLKPFASAAAEWVAPADFMGILGIGYVFYMCPKWIDVLIEDKDLAEKVKHRWQYGNNPQKKK